LPVAWHTIGGARSAHRQAAVDVRNVRLSQQRGLQIGSIHLNEARNRQEQSIRSNAEKSLAFWSNCRSTPFRASPCALIKSCSALNVLRTMSCMFRHSCIPVMRGVVCRGRVRLAEQVCCTCVRTTVAPWIRSSTTRDDRWMDRSNPSGEAVRPSGCKCSI
jgi:hypothetical protein